MQTRIYADDDGVRKEEIAALRGENMYRCGRLYAKVLMAGSMPRSSWQVVSVLYSGTVAVCPQTLHVHGAVQVVYPYT